ncbi:hypothetical protein STCU_04754 [Strigomonas culicis]|uniref:Dynein assembly factor 1, axonemal homolog n=1 Tax=Strigomonas culicis TaxID=28005 RepID=S9UE12_9TRYP|nr:hypothetical protein STCU_05387 [Strigomonas culicis]EPY29042.1 hypothetical protein STCU_04754 [Strigomonas culicis]|eukprot:EPY27950.1 hypothetical protein STCU_05387 [Strigomonas culicis]
MQVPIEESSTNDATSSRHSTTNTSFSQNEAGNVGNDGPRTGDQPKLNVLTTDGIIKECIKQGFYRNPICNEKLYLHNKSYDVVAPTAFDLYTDVKVLWLEGNALRTLPIGGTFIQTRPPKNKYAYLDEEEEEEEEKTDLQAHVDPMQDLTNATAEDNETTTPPATDSAAKERLLAKKVEQERRQKIAVRAIKKELAVAAALLPEPHEIVDDTQKDAFSSLYPTVRQLYLHNNLFRAMPDLHRFQLLDSVHLGNNFFSAIVPFCPFWDQKMEAVVAQLQKEDDTATGEALAAETRKTVMESLLQHLLVPPPLPTATDVTVQPGGGDPAATTLVLATDAAEKQREALLQLYKKLTERCYTLCEHTPIAVEEGTGAIPAAIPTAQRCPCSTLRTLNLSNNRLSEFTDVLPLLAYHAITTLDLSNNQLHDGEGLLLVLEKLPRLLSLRLQGNPLTRTLRRYRQRILSHCKRLVYLDDRPVFEEERRLVTAWAKGGDAAVNKERACIKAENEAKQQKRLDDFRALLANARNAAADGPGSPHSSSGDAYIAAVTTDAALAAAGAGAGAVVYENQYHIQNANQNERRPSNNEDADDSPTSDDEEDDEDASSETAPHTTPAATADARMALVGEEAAVETNKAPNRVAYRERVLSSNRATAPITTAVRPDDDVDDGEEDDIYIPSS